MNLEPDDAKRLSASIFRLTSAAPFFAALARYARLESSLEIPTAATDGISIFWNPDFLRSLSKLERDAVLLHEVLHCALSHITRRGVREAKLWNIACDIVVNGMIAAEGKFTLPKGHIRMPVLEHLAVEEVYALLQKQMPILELPMLDLLESAPSDCQGQGNQDGDGKSEQDGDSKGDKDSASNSASNQDSKGKQAHMGLTTTQKARLEQHWREALRRAEMSCKSQGSLPLGMQRELARLGRSQLNWQALLARFLIRTPTDFTGFDRRFLHQKIYLEALEGDSVQTFVCMDTSGSIGQKEMNVLFTEVQAALRAYPQVSCELFFADAALYGGYNIKARDKMPIPQGGGGTDFRPFFTHLERQRIQADSVAIYLTDGFGEFPVKKPRLPVLWVVVAGGLESDKFPFGTVVRMV
jgi:predicted metal-dependent peptidase